jgi:hypothetical protein
VGEGAGIFKRPDTKKRASPELSDAPTETRKDSKRNKGPVKEMVRDIINKGLCLDSNIPEHGRARLFKLHHDSGLKVLEAFKELMSKNKGAEKEQLSMQSLERVAPAPSPMRMAPAPAPAPMQEASQPVFGKLSCAGKQTDKVLAALNVKCAAARPSGAGTGGLGPGARGGVGEGAAAEAAGAGGRGGGGGEGGGGSAKGREAALRRELEVVKRERDAAIRELRWKEEATRRELEVVKRERDAAIRHKEEALRELRSREEATRRAEAAVGARDEAIRSKDAEIARLRRLAYGVEVLDVDAGVTRVVEEAGAGAEPPLKRMRLEQAAGARVVGALQERLVAVKKEQVEERATRHSELRASVDAKVKAAVKEALAQVADALECACCFEPLAPGTAVALECGHTYCNRQACASSSVTACPECRQPIGARVPLFGVLANVCGLLPRDA